jgi:MerR family transcriptional regulator/heat shock protein HspR
MTRTVITISQAAQRLGITTRTIRVYEQEGLISIDRSGGRTSLTAEDLEVILAAQRLKHHLGVNPAGAGVILEMRKRMAELEARLAEMERDFDRRLNEALEMERRKFLK